MDERALKAELVKPWVKYGEVKKPKFLNIYKRARNVTNKKNVKDELIKLHGRFFGYATATLGLNVASYLTQEPAKLYYVAVYPGKATPVLLQPLSPIDMAAGITLLGLIPYTIYYLWKSRKLRNYLKNL